MNYPVSENEMIVFLQTNGAKFDKNSKGWTHPVFPGFFSMIRLYQILRLECTILKKVDNK